MSHEDTRSISAYEFAERVTRYDADMEVMHPRRSKMIDILIEVLPFERDQRIRVLDLGVGTGYLSQRLASHYSEAHIVAVDGAEAMIGMAQARLADLGKQVRFVLGDFRRLHELVEGPFDAVVSSYALHHLNPGAKMKLLDCCADLLLPGGWFVNADLVVAETAFAERRIQQLRVDGIVRRADPADERFRNDGETRRFLDELEHAEGDQPVKLSEDLRTLEDSGLTDVAVYWREYREVVYAGLRPQS